MSDLAYAATMEALRPKCPICALLASVGGAFGLKDGTPIGYVFTCPNKHQWNIGPLPDGTKDNLLEQTFPTSQGCMCRLCRQRAKSRR